MKTLDRLNIKSLDGLAVMNVNEPSVGDYERIMAENRRLVAASAEYEKIIAELEQVLKNINREELNSMRPGGGYSRSARLSYEALQKLKGFRGEK